MEINSSKDSQTCTCVHTEGLSGTVCMCLLEAAQEQRAGDVFVLLVK